jgi:hypothetical protein
LSGNVAPFPFLAPILNDRSDDIAEYFESALGGTNQGLGLLAHGDDLHLRLAALGDGDGLAAFGDLVDQGEAARLEGSCIDLAVHWTGSYVTI